MKRWLEDLKLFQTQVQQQVGRWRTSVVVVVVTAEMCCRLGADLLSWFVKLQFCYQEMQQKIVEDCAAFSM